MGVLLGVECVRLLDDQLQRSDLKPLGGQGIEIEVEEVEEEEEEKENRKNPECFSRSDEVGWQSGLLVSLFLLCAASKLEFWGKKGEFFIEIAAQLHIHMNKQTIRQKPLLL